MAESASIRHLPYPDYLALEAQAETRHEYHRGEIYAMAGGTREHGRLAARIIAELGLIAKGRACSVFNSDVRIRVAETDRSFYADAFVVCGAQQTAHDDAEAITNPILVVEVLSESTEAYDRGEKFAHYARLASLREYVLISQTAHLVQVFRREGERWPVTESREHGTVLLQSLGGELAVDELYANPTPGPPAR